MNLEIESSGDTKIVRIKEEKFSYPMLSEFFDRTSSIIDSGASRLVINLSTVSCLDSASLGCLMDLFHDMSEHDGSIELVGLQERVAALLSMVGLTNRMGIFRNERAALESDPYDSDRRRACRVA